MNIKRNIVITTLAILICGCSEEIEVNNPKSEEDCMTIKDANKLDQCKRKVLRQNL